MKRCVSCFLMILLMFGFCACSSEQSEAPPPDASPDAPVMLSESPAPTPEQAEPEPSPPPENDVLISSHRMETYSLGRFSIQYPVFEGENCEQLNALVYDKAYELANTNEYISIGGELIGDIQSEITFIGKYIVSLIFWGEAYYNVSMHPGDMLIALNIDLATMTDIPLDSLYDTGDINLSRRFFRYAYFPSPPLTGHTEDRFKNVRKYDIFYNEDGLPDLSWARYFLKPDGIVFSLLATHVSGHDHFEAQVDYDVLEKVYIGPAGYFDGPQHK